MNVEHELDIECYGTVTQSSHIAVVWKTKANLNHMERLKQKWYTGCRHCNSQCNNNTVLMQFFLLLIDMGHYRPVEDNDDHEAALAQNDILSLFVQKRTANYDSLLATRTAELLNHI